MLLSARISPIAYQPVVQHLHYCPAIPAVAPRLLLVQCRQRRPTQQPVPATPPMCPHCKRHKQPPCGMLATNYAIPRQVASRFIILNWSWKTARCRRTEQHCTPNTKWTHAEQLDALLHYNTAVTHMWGSCQPLPRPKPRPPAAPPNPALPKAGFRAPPLPPPRPRPKLPLLPPLPALPPLDACRACCTPKTVHSLSSVGNVMLAFQNAAATLAAAQAGQQGHGQTWQMLMLYQPLHNLTHTCRIQHCTLPHNFGNQQTAE